MAKYNIYLINDLDGLETSLGNGYSLVSDYGSNNVNFKFYVSDPQYGNVWWSEQYKDRLPSEYHDLQSTTYSAVLLAITDLGNVYAISMGRSYALIDNYCDRDFGINLAQRLGDNTKSKMKSSTFNGGVKNRSIVSNSDYSNLDFSGGESIALLKMKSLEEAELGKSAVIFGSSIQISNTNITHNDIGRILNEFDNILVQAPRFRIPRATWVVDKTKIERLTNKMIDAIDSGNCDGMINFFDYDQFGTNILFTHEHTWKIKYGKDIYEKEYDNLSASTIREYCKDARLSLRGAFNLLKIVAVSNDIGRTYTHDLIRFIDYTDDEERCYLENGRWKQFNPDYLEDLQYWIRQIPLSDLDFEFKKTEFEKWRNQEKQKKKPAYKELFYNTKLSEKFGYELYDRRMDYKMKRGIEICDLYDKEAKKIIITKRGEVKDFGYAVDQANSVITLVVNGMYNPGNNKEEDVQVKKLELLLILNKRKNVIKSLEKDIKSFTFLSKINAIYALCREKSIEFGIRFAYEDNGGAL